MRRLYWRDFADILARLKAAPMTHHAAAEMIRPGCRRNLRDRLLHVFGFMADKGVLHISGWEKRQKGNRAPVFALGSGESQPHPLGHAKKNRRPRHMKELLAFVLAWEALEFPCSVSDVTEASGMGRTAVLAMMRHLRSLGLCRVGAWLRRVGAGGSPTPLYMRGGGADAHRPKRLTKKQTQATWEANSKARALVGVAANWAKAKDAA